MSGVQVPSPPPSSPAPSAGLISTLRAFLRDVAPDEPLVVAYSGGPDSTALLLGLVTVARDLDAPPQLIAAHLDHALDRASTERAELARTNAASLGVHWQFDRRPIPTLRRRGESLEEAARRVRYEFLEEVRTRLGAGWIATAHHRDDQIETVLMRWLSGSGIAGLAAMAQERGSIVRPLLGTPRSELLAYLASTQLPSADDPANRDPQLLRSRIRHLLLPRLASELPDLPTRLLRIARSAGGAARAIEARLELELAPRSFSAHGPSLAVADLRALPSELMPFALAGLHRAAKLPKPPSSVACNELARQITAGGRIEVDCGQGWRWTERAGRVELSTSSTHPPRATAFTYTFPLPGTVEISELGLVVEVQRGRTEPWMFGGHPDRVGLVLPAGVMRATVRSRRPGDRLRPLGCSGSRKLKDLLIDRRIPREQRGEIPLFCIEDRIVWVPGVTLDDQFRLREEEEAWIVTLIRR